MDENRRVTLLKQLNGTPEEAAAAVRQLEAACGMPPAPALPTFTPEEKAALKRAHWRRRWLRLSPIRERIRAGLAFLFAPWRQKDEEGSIPRDLMAHEARLREMQEVVIASVKALKTSSQVGLLLHVRLAGAEKQCADLWDALVKIVNAVAGDDYDLTSSIQKPTAPTADPKKAIDELYRILKLEVPTKGETAERKPDACA